MINFFFHWYWIFLKQVFAVITFFKGIELISPHQMQSSIHLQALFYKKWQRQSYVFFKLSMFLRTAVTTRRCQSCQI